MKPLPKYIPLGGWNWKVKLVGGLKDSEGSLGDTDVDKHVIRIDSSLSLEEQWHTLFHESIHAVWFLGGHTEEMSEEKEEALVRCTENLLWPWLRKYIGRK